MKIILRWLGCVCLAWLLIAANRPSEHVMRPFNRWTSTQVLAALQRDGLEAQPIRTGSKGQDDGMAAFIAMQTTAFAIPSAGAEARGLILSFNQLEDLSAMQQYYAVLGQTAFAPPSWLFTHGNILLQLHGAVPESVARRYAEALYLMR